jgi:hypothetical protein
LNFVAHVVVARLANEGASTRFLLGAAAPDLVRMARLPVATEGPEDLLAGVAAHHRTDAAFHGSEWFRSRNRALVTELKDRGVRRGPARGAGHVLVELLLDGVLLGDDGHADVFAGPWAALAAADEDARSMVPPAHHERWVDLLGQLTTRLDPASYSDPTYAADRTAGTLGRRPRLAMTDDELATLRAVAGDAQPDIRAGAPDIVDEVVGALAP